MKIQLLCALLLAALAGCAAPQNHADHKIKVLVLTGGHGFKAEPFFKMFSDNPEITFTADQQVKAAEIIRSRRACTTSCCMTSFTRTCTWPATPRRC